MTFSSSLSPQEVSRVVRHNKESESKGLISDLLVAEWETVLEDFSYRCPYTGSTDISMEHFIPESIGHGGTYLGNVYPIKKELNASKHNTNPFLWRETLSPKQKQVFDEIVLYLANQLNMDVNEFRDFVFWCFGNPRSKEQIERDKKRGFFSSLDLWNHTKRKEEKRQRVLSHFAEKLKLETDLFVDFSNWCIEQELDISSTYFPLYIQSLFSPQKAPHSH